MVAVFIETVCDIKRAFSFIVVHLCVGIARSRLRRRDNLGFRTYALKWIFVFSLLPLMRHGCLMMPVATKGSLRAGRVNMWVREQEEKLD